MKNAKLGTLNPKLILSFVLAILIGGCVGFKEGTKGFLGVSTSALEDARKDAVKKSFPRSYDFCYAKTQEILNKIQAYVYARDINKKMIAIYVSEQETTPVGIFFNQVKAGQTEIEVSSRSAYFKNIIAGKLFDSLEKEINSHQ